jgi:hypothetical protein
MISLHFRGRWIMWELGEGLDGMNGWKGGWTDSFQGRRCTTIPSWDSENLLQTDE